DSVDAMPPPRAQPLPARPPRWTPDNLQIGVSIVANGNFTWAEATRGGTRLPPDQATVDAIVRIALLAQEARDRIGRPFVITSWYRPAEINARVGGASMSRHIVGDAIDFYCEGFTGRQLYWALDPWWPGGLGRYSQFPYLCHLDARGHRARWFH
ncbi:MAG: peptidase M15A, partial [Leptolyngbya sp. SIO1D8]|nr:peptidase M15A [Leptolyngbya sp. SIO1D8]